MTVWPAAVSEPDLGAVVAIAGPRPSPEERDPGGGKGAEFGKSTPVALFVIVLLAIAVVLLIRSMTKHLKKVPASFDDPPQPDAKRQADSTATD